MSKAILRIFSYLYHLVLGLFLLIISSLTLFSKGHILRLEMLPWDDPVLSYIVFFGTLVGTSLASACHKGKASASIPPMDDSCFRPDGIWIFLHTVWILQLGPLLESYSTGSRSSDCSSG